MMCLHLQGNPHIHTIYFVCFNSNSYLQVTSRKDQEQYWAHRHRPYHFVPVREFAEAYQQFFIGAEMKQELAVPYPKEQSHKAALSTEKYSVTNKDLLKANFGKQWLLMKRNAIVYIFMVLQVMTNL